SRLAARQHGAAKPCRPARLPAIVGAVEVAPLPICEPRALPGEPMTKDVSAAIEIGPRPSVAIAGSTERFPVRRIYCVGQNYRAHALEMGANPDREPPFFFMKPADAVGEDGATVAYPPATSDLHHEVELVVAIGRAGSDIAPAAALGHVFGYAVGLDLTRRDLQAAARRVGRPWE